MNITTHNQDSCAMNLSMLIILLKITFRHLAASSMKTIEKKLQVDSIHQIMKCSRGMYLPEAPDLLDATFTCVHSFQWIRKVLKGVRDFRRALSRFKFNIFCNCSLVFTIYQETEYTNIHTHGIQELHRSLECCSSVLCF